MAGPRDPRYTPRPVPPSSRSSVTPGAAQPGRPVAAGERPRRSKPDANPMRLMFGLVGIASISAFTAAMVPSIAPAPVADAAAAAADVTTADAIVPVEAPPVRHVTRYVTLQPGQTPPPGAAVNVQPTPTPILKTQVVVKPKPKPKAVTRSRQSGQP